MSRLTNSTPKYRKHKASGQAIVELNGHRFYLGPHGTKASHLEYDRLIAEWLQNGRQLRSTSDATITVVEVIAAYLRFARGYYRKGGRITTEFAGIKRAARPLHKLYGPTLVAEFGPLRLQSVRQQLVNEGLSRGVVNQLTGRIKRMFKWAASQELISAAIPQALSMVAGLRKGRTEAHDFKPVAPVDDALVNATLPLLPEVVADMVRFQRLTGCRPAEVCILRPCDVDRSGDAWQYTPESHKTEHRGGQRVIFIGPQAQGVLLRYLARGARDYCFCPTDSERKRRTAQHAARVTPLSSGNRPESNRKRRPKRKPGKRYTTDSYRRAIYRACDKLFPAPANVTANAEALADWQAQRRWAPNQLRHSAATQIRRRFGLEAAQVVLGHAAADVTQVYAERDFALAARVAREVG